MLTKSSLTRQHYSPTLASLFSEFDAVFASETAVATASITAAPTAKAKAKRA